MDQNSHESEMIDFFTTCLLELESVAGIQQFHWLCQKEDKDKQVKILIDGMVWQSKKFSYIPLKYQKEIIRKMMCEDQTYEAINSRVIFKWLEMHKNVYSTMTEEEMQPEPEPATKEQRDKWAAIFFENLSKIGNPPQVNGMKQLRESKGYSEGITSKEPRPKFIVGEPCEDCKGKGFTESDNIANPEKSLCEKCLGSGKFPQWEVYAANQDYADKVYEDFKVSR